MHDLKADIMSVYARLAKKWNEQSIQATVEVTEEPTSYGVPPSSAGTIRPFRGASD